MTNQCETEGCTEPGEAWQFPIEDDNTIILCPDHAIATGFCVGCGGFVLGVEGDEQCLQKTGLCRDCWNSEFEDDEYDADLDFGWDYPHNWYDPDCDTGLEDSTHTYIGPRDTPT